MIYDCFPFFNELDVLEIRLNVLNDSVDRFVLVESTRTHQGKSKELFYQLNKERFVKFQKKVIHVISDTFPSSNMTPWEYEQFQRSEIMRGLVHCQPDDVILISDLDEIPDPAGILIALPLKGIKIFRQKTYFHFLNCSGDLDNASRKGWNGSGMVSFAELESPQHLRNLAIRSSKQNNSSIFKSIAHRLAFAFGNFFHFQRVTIIMEGGWHFSYMGRAQKIIEKLEAFAHCELNTDYLKNEERILERINKGLSVFDNTKLKFVQLDNTFPKYLLDNKEKYKHLLK